MEFYEIFTYYPKTKSNKPYRTIKSINTTQKPKAAFKLIVLELKFITIKKSRMLSQTRLSCRRNKTGFFPKSTTFI